MDSKYFIEKVNFLKKILIGIILISLIVVAFSLTARINKIDQKSEIEIVMDGESYTELKALAPEINLQKLKNSGMTTIAIYQKSLEDFIDNGSLKKLENLDILLADDDLQNSLKKNGIKINELENSAIFAVFSRSLKKQLNSLASELKNEYSAEIIQTADYNLLYFPNWHKSLEDLSLGYNSNQVEEAKKIDLKIAYRSDNKLNSFSALKSNLKLLNPEILIFNGEEITGYPDKIAETAALMKKYKLDFGQVEAFIAAQAGAEKLAVQNDYKILRTHSMQQEEVEKANAKEIINRYLLAVRERNVKIIYYKPYLQGDQLLSRNLDLLSSLKLSLEAEGYKLGSSETIEYFSSSNLDLALILLAITAAGIMLLNYFTAFNYSKLINLFFLISAAAGFIFFETGKIILLRQIMALAAAVIFPSLAVIVFLIEKNKGAEDLKGVLKSSFLFCNYTAAVITALIGGLFVSASLNSSDFIFKINNFRGVKLAFLLPLIIISLYYFIQPGNKELKKEIPKLLESAIKVKHLILAAALALIAVIYIGRTGNFPLLPVPAWELTLRSFLEKMLYVRPRFKEFLIGHPLFIFSLYLSYKKRKELCFYPFLMLSSVGVITTVNTFSHLHTPLLVSMLRTFHSYWLSFIIASILILFYRLFKHFYKKYYYLWG